MQPRSALGAFLRPNLAPVARPDWSRIDDYIVSVVHYMHYFCRFQTISKSITAMGFDHSWEVGSNFINFWLCCRVFEDLEISSSLSIPSNTTNLKKATNKMLPRFSPLRHGEKSTEMGVGALRNKTFIKLPFVAPVVDLSLRCKGVELDPRGIHVKITRFSPRKSSQTLLVISTTGPSF